jgi:hypothetical protein
MSQQTKIIIAILIAFASVTVMSVLADTVYLPAVYRQPTLTPTITPTPTKTPTPTPTKTPLPEVEIVNIVYDPPIDLDEYVEIKNFEDKLTVKMGTWIIKADTGELYEFPDNFDLGAGKSVKVWTKDGTNSATNLYWGNPTEIWIKGGNCAYLKIVKDDGSKIEIDTYCY